MNASTHELSQELAKREGISTIIVEPYQEIKITVGDQETNLTGPAVVLINQD